MSLTTTPPTITPASMKAAADRAARGPWMEGFARAGYAAKGGVHILVGGLAGATAIGAGGAITNSEGALATILAQPFGQILLGLTAVGLAAYALWRLTQSVLDPDRKGTDAKGVAVRLGQAFSGLAYAGLAVSAFAMLIGYARRGGENEAARGWTTTLMAQPFGRWLVAIAGGIACAVAVMQLYKAYAAKLSEQLDLSRLAARTQIWVRRVARFGLAARGVVFGIIGLFLFIAAWRSDPSRARGFAGALRAVEAQSYGPWLLGVVALGLVAYGLYMIVEARHRRFAD